MTKAPPRLDELELSVFGPGFGECSVVHLGMGDWMIVDSCTAPGSRIPVGLQYLQDLGVDVATAVKLIVVTHWHDDHMRGAAAAFEACTSAEFVCSAALRRKEFFTLVAANSSLHAKSADTPGVVEFSAILETLQKRAPAGVRSPTPTWGIANRQLFVRSAGVAQPGASVHALSPSDASVTIGFRGIAPLLPAAGESKRAAVALEPNEAALVLLVTIGDRSILLGADLETGRDPSRGWRAITGNAARPQSKALLYKVAHHGSPTAEDDSVWLTLLTENPIAVLTPFFRGNVSLPSGNDVARIKQRAQRLFSASPPRAPSPSPRSRAVEKTIREVAKSLRPRSGRMGQVRLRARDGETQIDLIDAAVEL